VEFLESKNYSSRGSYAADGIVIHYTGGSDGRRTAEWLRTRGAGRSAHYVGYRDGKGCQLVPIMLAAWHAGASEWIYKGESKYGCNRYTIGVELANCGLLYRGRGGWWYEIAGNMYAYQGLPPIEAELVYDNGAALRGFWEPYPEAQMVWLEALIDMLEAGGVPRRLVGHEEIAMPFSAKKRDPGPLFPWARFGRPNGRRTASVITET